LGKRLNLSIATRKPLPLLYANYSPQSFSSPGGGQDKSYMHLLKTTDKQCKKSTKYLYNTSSVTYDSEIGSWGWAVPQMCVDLLIKHRPSISDAKKAIKVFDCGCGTGMVADALHNAFADGKLEVHGVDESTGMMSIATQKGLYSSLTECDLNVSPHLPANIADQSFDALICSGVFSYMEKTKIVDILRAMHRICKRDALVVISHRADYMTNDIRYFEKMENDGYWKRELLTDGELYLPGNPNYGERILVQLYVGRVIQ
jgi:2-polyprenyl-3-methyl-5-hydroxy-6-metoxy-1,4-benzoquinol methylase